MRRIYADRMRGELFHHMANHHIAISGLTGQARLDQTWGRYTGRIITGGGFLSTEYSPAAFILDRRIVPLTGAHIVDFVQRNGITDRGQSTFTLGDERRWGVNVTAEYQFHRTAFIRAGRTPLSMSEFIRVASLFWEAEALYLRYNQIMNFTFQVAVTGLALQALTFALIGGGAAGSGSLVIGSNNIGALQIQAGRGILRFATGPGVFTLPLETALQIGIAGTAAVALSDLLVNQIRDLNLAIDAALAGAAEPGVPSDEEIALKLEDFEVG